MSQMTYGGIDEFAAFDREASALDRTHPVLSTLSELRAQTLQPPLPIPSAPT